MTLDDGFAGGVCRCQACGTIQKVPAHLKGSGDAPPPSPEADTTAANVPSEEPEPGKSMSFMQILGIVGAIVVVIVIVLLAVIFYGPAQHHSNTPTSTNSTTIPSSVP